MRINMLICKLEVHIAYSQTGTVQVPRRNQAFKIRRLVFFKHVIKRHVTLPGQPLIWVQSKEDKVKSSLLCDMGHQSNRLALGVTNLRRQAMNKMQAPSYAA